MEYNMEAAIKQQIFRKQTPDYVAQSSPEAQLYSCTCCGDKFHLKSSYDFHVNRKSVKITYTCKICNFNYVFTNRCRLIQHLLNHSKSNVPFKLSDIKIYPFSDETSCKSPNINQPSILMTSSNERVNGHSVDLQTSSTSNTKYSGTGSGTGTPNIISSNTLSMEKSIMEMNTLISNKVTANLSGTIANTSKRASNPINLISNHFNSLENITALNSGNYDILEINNHTCTECNIEFKSSGAKFDKFTHFNKRIKSYICKVCTLNMPNLCSLKCHLRIHFQTPPHVCPDCGTQFQLMSHLVFHATFICKHLTKSIYVHCVFTPCEALLNVTEIPKHVQSNHVTSVYRCKHCIYMSISENNIMKHHNSAHSDIVYGDADVYHDCILCPSMILPSDLENHLKVHISHKRYYMFLCPGCTTPLNDRDMLLEHQKQCNMYKVLLASAEKALNRAGILINAEKDSPNWNGKESPSKSEISHGTNNITGGEVVLQTKNNSDIERMAAKTFRCHLCASLLNIDFKSINKHFSALHKELMFIDVRLELTRLEDEQNESNKNNKVENILGNKHDNKTHIATQTPTLTFESSSIPLFKYVDSSHLQANARKRRKRHKNSNNLKPFTSGMFASLNGLSKENVFVCSKCNFTTSEKEPFREHIVSHRDVSTAYQCMECGSCFAVKPSFSTHLFVCHKINDSDDYMLKNNCYDEQALRQLEEDLLIAKFNTVNSSIDKFQCSICMLKCQNQSDFDKHFRVHGMAFLLKRTIRLDM